MQIQVWAPANLLLVGEYVVTEKGGLGIAAAVQPELQVSLCSAPEFMAEAYTAKPLFQWHAHEAVPQHAELTAACLESLGYHEYPPVHIKIDSSAFYTEDGTKRGLGSSAAVAAALVSALFLYKLHMGLHLLDPKDAAKLRGMQEGCIANLESGSGSGSRSRSESRSQHEVRSSLLRHAVNAHRKAQGGGSAYDVTASLFGGLGLFRGGDLPGWEALPAEALPPAIIRYGNAPVSSPAAVLGYKGLKAAEPEFVNQHVRQSNQETLQLVAALRAHDQDSFGQGLRRMARLGLDLGARVGVPAEIEPVRSGYGKAVGAGNEIAVLFPDSSCAETGAGQDQPLHVASQGVRWCISA